MPVRRLASVTVLLALFTLLVGVSAPTEAQDKKDKDKAKAKDGDDATTALMSMVEEAVKAKDYRHDPKHGNGKTPYDQMASKPAVLVGLDIYPGRATRPSSTSAGSSRSGWPTTARSTPARRSAGSGPGACTSRPSPGTRSPA